MAVVRFVCYDFYIHWFVSIFAIYVILSWYSRRSLLSPAPIDTVNHLPWRQSLTCSSHSCPQLLLAIGDEVHRMASPAHRNIELLLSHLRERFNWSAKNHVVNRLSLRSVACDR